MILISFLVPFFNNWKELFCFSMTCSSWFALLDTVCSAKFLLHMCTLKCWCWSNMCVDRVFMLWKSLIQSVYLSSAPSRSSEGGQRSKSTASRHQTEYKCSCDPELMICNEHGEVGEHESSRESFSSSLRLWITLTSNNFQPLTLHNVRPLRLSLTDISQIASCTFKDDSLWAQEGVESSRASKEHLFPPRSSHILTPISILYECDCN